MAEGEEAGEQHGEQAGEQPVLRLWVFVAVVIALLTALAVISSVAFNGTLNRDPVGTLAGPASVDEGVDVTGTVTNVDHAKNQVTLRLAVVPTGTLDMDGTPRRPITMYYGSIDGTKKASYDAGLPLSTTEVLLSLREVADPLQPQVASPIQGSYPWDTYDAELNLRFVASATPEPGADATSGVSAPGTEVLPVNLAVYKTVPGFTVASAGGRVTSVGNVHMTLEVARSSTAKFFSLLVTIIMWALAIGVLLITISVVQRRMKLETAQLSMMAVILFAMPAALRSFQPGIPPPGVLSDFYGFFWSDIVVALCLVTMLIVYLQRRAE